MDDAPKKSLVAIIIILAVLGVLGYYLFSSDSGLTDESGQAGADNPVVQNVPEVTSDQLLGKAELSADQQSDIVQHKADILVRVRSRKSLSPEEKSAIGNIMLTEAHLYNFTPEEQKDIFDALRK